jgi:hypothetical protein
MISQCQAPAAIVVIHHVEQYREAPIVVKAAFGVVGEVFRTLGFADKGLST